VKQHLNLDKLREKTLVVATPMYGGLCTQAFHSSMMRLAYRCWKYEIRMVHDILWNESLITRARNQLTDRFLATKVNGYESTHLLWIDADIEFDGLDVLIMLDMDKPVVAGPYPKKTINWQLVRETVIQNPDMEPAELSEVVGEFVINLNHGTDQVNLAEPISVKEVGTGFMMVKREVFLEMREKGVAQSYDLLRGEKALSDDKLWDFYPAGIDPIDNIYLSEDYAFCRRWTRMGGEILLCPWVKLNHHGPYVYKGNLPAIARAVEGKCGER